MRKDLSTFWLVGYRSDFLIYLSFFAKPAFCQGFSLYFILLMIYVQDIIASTNLQNNNWDSKLLFFVIYHVDITERSFGDRLHSLFLYFGPDGTHTTHIAQ